MTAITPNPVAAVLSVLAAAYRNNMVSYGCVPEECRPPRFVVEFGTGAEVRAFEKAIHQLADVGPELHLALGEIAVNSYASITGPATSLEVLRWLLAQTATELLEVIEDHGPVKVLQPSAHAREKLVFIAALAIAGIIRWDRENAPGEAGEVPAAPPTMDDVVGEQLAACADGLGIFRPVYSAPITTERYRPSNGTEGDAFFDQWCARCLQWSEDEHCPIQIATMALDITDPDYPDQWVHDAGQWPGNPRCTAFAPKEG